MSDGQFSQFKEHSVAEFFKKNRQMLGFSGKVRSLTTLVHEYVTNSLDACEEAGILPDIMVQVENLENGHVRLTVEDNGSGIPKKIVGKALGQMLAGTKFNRYMQQRGQQGIGASGAGMFSQITTGKPVKFKTSQGDGKIFQGDLKIDFKSNKPIIDNDSETDGNYRGLWVQAEFADVKYDKSDYAPQEYLKRTALMNPHAQILFIEPAGERFLFPRASDVIPQKPKEIQPHPLGITTSDLVEFAHASQDRKLSSFFVNTFSRFSYGKVDELKALFPAIDFEMQPKELNWEQAEALVKKFRELRWIAPEMDALRPVGSDQVQKALKNIYNAEFMSVTERKPKVFRGGIPFMVEAALAYGGNTGKRKSDGGVGGDILRFANRVPLLFDAGGCGITDAVKTIDWRRYDIRDFDNEPVSVLINFVSVHVPYTGAGKQAIAEEEEIIEEIRLAVMDAAREMQRYLHGKVREASREAKKKAITRYASQLAHDLTQLGAKGKPAEVEKKLLKMIEDKYSQLTLEEAEEGEEEESAKDDTPNGNGEDKEE